MATSYNKLFLFFFIVFWLIINTNFLQAQNCNCTYAEVESNTVAPCTSIIGSTIIVSTPAEFTAAINQVNASGGNLTILIINGTYQIASPTSYPYITASNVVIRSISGNRDDVVLRGTGMASTASTENIFGVAGDNVTIADLTIEQCGNHGIQVSGANLFVHNVHFKNTYEQMLKGSTSASSIDSAIVQCSLFEYTAGVGPNWYIGGLDIHKGLGWIVRDNVFKNIISPSGSVAEHAIHFWNSSSDNIVERNWIINCDRGIGFGLGSSPNSGGIIRNNMIYNGGGGQFSDVGIGLETSPNTKVYNNTIYISYQNAIEYRFTATTAVDIKNNLTNKAITSRNGGTANLLTNVTNAQAAWFVNTGIGDLHLAINNSSVVDQGTTLTMDVADDIDKTLRPLAAGYDIGAHEFSAPLSLHEPLGHANDFYISPNPAGNYIHLHLLNNKAFEVIFFNALGEKVLQAKNQKVFSVSHLSAGVYWVKVNNQFRKFIKN